MHGLALVGYFSLLVLWLFWNTVLAPPQHMPVALALLLSVAPLGLPLRGLLRRQAQAYLLAAVLSLGYFMHGVTEAMVNAPERLPAVIEIACSLALFFGASLSIRFVR
jgi:uncharacterized membrane protein